MADAVRPIRRTIDGRELTFIRCDADGRELDEGELITLGITNRTIFSVVDQATGRIPISQEGALLVTRLPGGAV